LVTEINKNYYQFARRTATLLNRASGYMTRSIRLRTTILTPSTIINSRNKQNLIAAAFSAVLI
jgi:hypothetical protein